MHTTKRARSRGKWFVGSVLLALVGCGGDSEVEAADNVNPAGGQSPEVARTESSGPDQADSGQSDEAADASKAADAPAAVAAESDATPPRPAQPPALGRATSRDLGDLDQVLKERRLRVLVPYARPFFFVEEGQPKGITFELFREFGTWLEEQNDLRRGDLSIICIPCPLDAVIPWLNEGYGDVAAGALTITPERESEVAFSVPLMKDVDEVLLASQEAPPVTKLADLAGREVWVADGSSYAEHLAARSEELVAKGLEPIRITLARSTLTTTALIEMVHAGILDYIVCDAYLAELWAQELDGLRLHSDVKIHTGGELAWAVRKDNTQLHAALNDFAKTAKKGSLLGNILIKRYFGSTKWIHNPIDEANRARIDRYAGWIQELSEEYQFDWLRVAAQCFQESRLDPDATSRSGALGLMQLLPSTAKDMGCEDPLDPEQNLRAGIKYLDWLRTNFFADPELDEEERMNFILAAYNAGPGNVRRWRKQAPDHGLDPNRWRHHVERLALEHVGVQPVRYVDNIEAYYVAYTLAIELQAAEREAEAPR